MRQGFSKPIKPTRPTINPDGSITLDRLTAATGLTATVPKEWRASRSFLPPEERSRIGKSPPRTYFGIATERDGYINELKDGLHPRNR